MRKTAPIARAIRVKSLSVGRPDLTFRSWYRLLVGMADACGKPLLDRWQRRRFEQILAKNLHATWESLRIAQIGVEDALNAVPTGVEPPDSNLLVKQAVAEAKRASDEYSKALAKWKDFVIRGTVPSELLEG